MATREVADLNIKPVHQGTWGNVSGLVAKYTVATATPLNSGDVLRLAKLQAETDLLDAILIASGTAAGAGATADLGYTSVSGSDTDADYFLAAQAVATNVKASANRALDVVTVDEDTYLTLTAGGANYANGAVITVILFYRYNGAG